MNKNERILGIIGGMGPDATCDLYKKITNLTSAKSDQEHLHIIIDSYSKIPDRTSYILENTKNPLPYLLKSANRLEQAGADFLIMACNTAHYFADDIQNEINIPLLSILHVVADKLNKMDINKAAILATTGTAKSQIYTKALAEKNIDAIYPSKSQNDLLMTLIYKYVKAGIPINDNNLKQSVYNMITDLKSAGAQAFVMACTELPLAFNKLNITGPQFIDATLELAKSAIDYAFSSN